MNENLIDQYLLNLLPPVEKTSFEARLENDESLKKELLLQKEAITKIEELGRIQLKSKLKDIHKDIHKSTKGRTSKIRSIAYRLAIASAFIGFLLVGWLWMQQSPSMSTLYSQNFDTFELSLNQRSGVENTFQEIENLYSNGDFTKAIPLFQKTLEESKNRSSQILLGLGISFLKVDQPNKAIPHFQEILDKQDFNFEDEANWYLGLTYLKLNDATTAKKYLSLLASDQEKDHHEDAVYILSHLD